MPFEGEKYANIALKGRGVAVSKEEEGKDTPSRSESTPLQEYLSFVANLLLFCTSIIIGADQDSINI